jgi:hypothetical protein
MSIEIQSAAMSLVPSSTVVEVLTLAGDVIRVMRVATYQVDPLTGHACPVKDGVHYESLQGERIDSSAIVRLADGPKAPPVAPMRIYFYGAGAPVYVENGVIYNLDGSIFNGSIDGYVPGYNQNTTVVRDIVWGVFPGDKYLPIRRTTVNGEATYSIDGNNISLIQIGAIAVAETLPPARFCYSNQVLKAGDTIALKELPLAGFAINYYAPLETICEPRVESAVIIQGAPMIGISGSARHNSNGMETIEVPEVRLEGKAVANVVLSFRCSPLLIDSVPVAIATSAS